MITAQERIRQVEWESGVSAPRTAEEAEASQSRAEDQLGVPCVTFAASAVKLSENTIEGRETINAESHCGT